MALPREEQETVVRIGFYDDVCEAKERKQKHDKCVEKRGIFCDGHCAELAFAAVVRNVRPMELREKPGRYDRTRMRERNEEEGRVFNMAPVELPYDEADDEEEDGFEEV